jgi:hypothetical protein
MPGPVQGIAGQQILHDGTAHGTRFFTGPDHRCTFRVEQRPQMYSLGHHPYSQVSCPVNHFPGDPADIKTTGIGYPSSVEDNGVAVFLVSCFNQGISTALFALME